MKTKLKTQKRKTSVPRAAIKKAVEKAYADKKIMTAEESLNQLVEVDSLPNSEVILWWAKDFANTHVRAALNAAAENVQMKADHEYEGFIRNVVDRSSITKAYSKKKIK